MIGLFAFVFAAMLGVMGAGWLVQRAAGNGGWTDVFWTFGTGAACALATLAPVQDMGWPGWRRITVAALVAIWALRLGGHVALRVARGPEDARYAKLRQAWKDAFQTRMLWLALVQAPATTILSVSVLLAARNPAPTFRLQDLLGVAILAAAICGEGVADGQMKRFKADPGNRGRVCDRGLWAWSRHPNYLFEFIGWLAYPVIAFDPHSPSSMAALAAPALMFVILRFGTGVPPLEAALVESKGDAYRRYQTRVSPFLPRPPKDQRS